MEHSKRIAQLNRALGAVATGAATILLTGDHSRTLMFRREIDCLIVLGTSLLSACVANGPPSAENLMQPTQVDLRVINGGDSSIIPTESQINVHNDFMSAESEGKLTFFNNQEESVEGNLIDFASNFLNPAEITSDVILTDVPPSLITFGETPIALQAVGFQAINPDTNQPMIKYSVFAQVGDQGPWTLLVTPENPDDESIGFSQVAGGVAVTKPINLVYLFDNEDPIPQPWIITGQNGQPFIAVIRPNGDGHGEFISADHRLVANDIAQDMSTPETRKLARRAMAKIALPTMTPTTEPSSTPIENPYSTLNYFDQSTWTQAMKDTYAAIPTRALGEYTQENLTLHNGLSFGMVNYLESKGITTYSSWNEANFSDYSQYIKLYADFRNQVNSDPALTIEQKISPVNPWFIEQTLTNPVNERLAYIGSDDVVHGGFRYSQIRTEAELIQAAQRSYPDKTISNIQDVMNIYSDITQSYTIQLFGKPIEIHRGVTSDQVYLQKVVDISPNPDVPNSYIITGQLDDGAYYAFNVSVGDSPLPSDTQVMINGQIVKLGDIAPGKQFTIHQSFDRQRTPQYLTLNNLVEYLGKSLVIDPVQGIPATDGSWIRYSDGFVQMFGPLETFNEFHQQP